MLKALRQAKAFYKIKQHQTVILPVNLQEHSKDHIPGMRMKKCLIRLLSIKCIDVRVVAGVDL
jgi:hypothetical protein